MKIKSQREYDECVRELRALYKDINYVVNASEYELAEAGWLDPDCDTGFYDFDLDEAEARAASF